MPDDLMNKTVRTPVGRAPVVPIMVVAAGAYLCWFGVRYWRSDTAWPSDPLKAVLTGKPMPTPDRRASEDAIKGITESSGQGGGGGGVRYPTTSGTLSKDQIKQLWTSNGGSERTANVAAAVALAESSGRTGITSPNPDGGTNVGLWQLDTKGVGAGHTITELQDPTMNARITVMATVNGTKWSQWAAHANGAYRKYL
jgi:hypothetical protein